MTKVMAANPDALAVAMFGASWSRTIKTARQIGLRCPIHYAYFSLPDARAAGDAVVGITGGCVFVNENPHSPRSKEFTDAFKQRFGEYPGEIAARGFLGIQAIMEAVKVAGTTDTEAVIDTMETMTYKDAVTDPTFHFRKEDHHAIGGIFTVEVIKDPKYQYGTKILAYDPNPVQLMAPPDQTGCGEYMKKRIK
jgi:branched-chain amino acid transport system substrate-binding protein